MKKIKKSYIKIFIFEIITFLILILNSFESNILNMYKMPFFLLILNIIFYLLLGYERDNKRYTKSIIIDLLIIITTFLVLYYLSGVVITFAKVDNYTSFYGITTIVIPLVLTIIFKEFLRNSLLTKSGDNLLLIVLTTILMIYFDISTSISIIGTKSMYNIFIFIALSLLPSISTNIFISYLTIKAGYKPSIVYLLYVTLYQYLLPIVPNPNKYFKSIIDLLLPIITMLIIHKMYSNPHDEEITSMIHKNKIKGLLIPTFLTLILVYFVSGYFRYYAIAVASGSMMPVFDKGSVVIVERLDEKYNNYNRLDVDDIIAFKYNNHIIIHRIIRIKNIDGITFFYTKGDANIDEDNFKIPMNDIVGVVKFHIPMLGYPTVWFSEL